MKRLVKSVFILWAAFFLSGTWAADNQESQDLMPTLTHADAAIILAKYSGFFDRYVEERAELSECVRFLNRTGIYFGLLEVVNGTEFTKRDAARVLGQIDLVLNGEAEYSSGKVKLPKGIESWEEYCTMNKVEYAKVHLTMLEMIHMAGEREQ